MTQQELRAKKEELIRKTIPETFGDFKDVEMVENEFGRLEPKKHLFPNAVSRIVDSTSLKITSNYGEVEGKVIKKSKSYKHVSSEASDNAIYSVYQSIDGMQEPTAENCYVVSTAELIEG